MVNRNRHKHKPSAVISTFTPDFRGIKHANGINVDPLSVPGDKQRPLREYEGLASSNKGTGGDEDG